jgi:hypothetical protein
MKAEVKFGEIKSADENQLDVNYEVSATLATHANDWIGLYRPNYKHHDDYVTYQWSERIKELESNQVSFHHTVFISIETLNISSISFVCFY